jgi:hypothetical protein
MHQKSTDKMDRTKYTKELAVNTKNTWAVRLLADRPPRTRELSARTNPVARARPLEGQTFLPFARSPKSTKGKLPNHRWRWSTSRRCYAYKFVASNPLIREESRFYRAQEQSKNSNRNPSIGGRIRSLTGHDQAQRCTRQLSMIPTNKSRPKHLRMEGTSRAQKSNKKSLKKTRKSHELQDGNRRNHESFHSLGS